MPPVFRRIFSSKSQQREHYTGNSNNEFSSRAPISEKPKMGFFHRFKTSIIALSTLAFSVVGCSSSGVESYSSLIGPNGGTISGPSGYSLQIPKGALNQDTELTLTPLHRDSEIISGAGLEPDGTKFNLPVILRFPIEGETKQYSLGSPVTVSHRSSENEKWSEATRQDGTAVFGLVTGTGSSLVAYPDHFSAYSIQYADLQKALESTQAAAILADLNPGPQAGDAIFLNGAWTTFYDCCLSKFSMGGLDSTPKECKTYAEVKVFRPKDFEQSVYVLWGDILINDGKIIPASIVPNHAITACSSYKTRVTDYRKSFRAMLFQEELIYPENKFNSYLDSMTKIIGVVQLPLDGGKVVEGIKSGNLQKALEILTSASKNLTGFDKKILDKLKDNLYAFHILFTAANALLPIPDFALKFLTLLSITQATIEYRIEILKNYIQNSKSQNTDPALIQAFEEESKQAAEDAGSMASSFIQAAYQTISNSGVGAIVSAAELLKGIKYLKPFKPILEKLVSGPVVVLMILNDVVNEVFTHEDNNEFMAASATIESYVFRMMDQSKYSRKMSELTAKPQTYREEVELAQMRAYNGYLFGSKLVWNLEESWTGKITSTVFGKLKDAVEGTDLQTDKENRIKDLQKTYAMLKAKAQKLADVGLVPDTLSVPQANAPKFKVLTFPARSAWGYDVVPTSDGGYLATGLLDYSNVKGSSLIKFDSNFQPTLVNLKGAYFSYGYSVVQAINGNYVFVAGAPNGQVIAEIDPNGKENWMWKKTNTTLSSVIKTTDGNYAFCAVTSSPTRYVGLGKLDTNGKELWYKSQSVGSSDYCYAVTQTKSGNYATLNVSGNDVKLVESDATGSVKWTKTYIDMVKGYTGSSQRIFSVEPTSDGGYVLSSDVNGFAKVDSVGVIEWQYSKGQFHSVIQTSDGGYIAAGKKSDSAWLLKTDSKGNFRWEITNLSAGCHDAVLYSVISASDGGYLAVGSAGSANGSGHNTFLLIKTDKDGNAK